MKARGQKQNHLEKAPGELHEASAPYRASEESMVRTQIYLTRAEHEFVRMEAARRGEALAAVIRSFIEEKMQLPEEIWENNPLLAAPADPEFQGPSDGAINHDHYVYGSPKRWVQKKGKWVEAPPLPENYYTDPERAAAYERELKEASE